MSAGWVEPSSLSLGDACLGATRALCNRCGELCDAKVVFAGAGVHLVKWCPTHGETRALVSSDAVWYRRSLSYLKAGTDPKRRAVAEAGACPDSCGLCPSHQQHTCVPILELTAGCDLDCPICLVAGKVPRAIALDEVRRILDGLVASEGRINMLTLSGGEPTLHPELTRVVELALRPEVGVVSISTNGVRLSRDEKLLRFLCERGVVISLQFDGVRRETWARLRGDPSLGELKRRLVERILELGGRVSLTMTLARGVNDDEGEVGEVLRLLFSHERVLSLMVQPEARMRPLPEAELDAVLDAVTIPEAVSLLARASGGTLKEADFTPLPCSHPTCFALTYLLRLDDGHLVSLPSLVDAEAYIDLTRNQALLNTDADSLLRIKDALYEVWTASGAVPQRDAVLGAIRRVLLEVNRLGPCASHRGLLEVGLRNVKSVFIHQFMDRYSFDLSRAVKCCNHYPQADGRLMPACVRNNIGLRAVGVSERR
jgi:hypothetical protein